MSADFTPGPWTLEISSKSGMGAIRGPMQNGSTRQSDNTGLVAEIDLSTDADADAPIFPDRDPEREANARLIAAAPTMYAALSEGAQLNLPDFLEWIADRLVNVHDENPNVDYVLTLRMRAEKCRSALLKATGGAG